MKTLQQFQARADRRWGFDFAVLDRIYTPNTRTPAACGGIFDPLTDAHVRRVEYTVLALAGEVGEMANHVKKVRRHLLLGGKLGDMDLDGLKEEAADVLAYLLKLSNLMKWNLERVYRAKMAENAKRFAPKRLTPRRHTSRKA